MVLHYKTTHTLKRQQNNQNFKSKQIKYDSENTIIITANEDCSPIDVLKEVNDAVKAIKAKKPFTLLIISSTVV